MDDHNEEWGCSLNMGIDAARMLYDHLEYSIQMWPGAPRRPYEEQEFLRLLKTQLFAMMADYNFNNITYKPEDK